MNYANKVSSIYKSVIKSIHMNKRKQGHMYIKVYTISAIIIHYCTLYKHTHTHTHIHQVSCIYIVSEYDCVTCNW